MEKQEQKSWKLIKKRVQTRNSALRLGIDRWVTFAIGTVPTTDLQRVRGVVFKVRNEVEALRMYRDLMAMAREAVDSNTVDEFLSALDQRPGKPRKAAPCFADFAQEWLDTRVKGAVRESQAQTDESILRCHLLPAFGRKNLDNICTRDIEKYLAKKRTETSPRGPSYSPKSLRNHLGVLNRILTSAIDYELITKNPITPRMWPKRHQAEEDLRPYWNPDEELAAFRVLDRWKATQPAFAYAMIVQMLFGLRFGELRALEKRDLDLKIPGLWVKRSMARKKTHAPKNGKARFHQLPVDLAEELDEYSRTTSGNVLFPSPTGNRLDNSVLNRAYARLAIEAGVPKITSHGARHTCASSSAAHGLSQAQIARYIGHADVATTQRYTHVADSGMRSLVDARWTHLKSDS